MKTDQVEIYCYRTFEYNLARFLTVMEGELRAMGATMVQVSPFKNKLHSPKPRYICNLDVSQRINRFSQCSAIILPYCGDEIRDLLQVDNAPQCVTYLDKIDFVFGPYCYTFWFSTVHLFCYRKVPVKNGQIWDAYCKDANGMVNHNLLYSSYQVSLNDLKTAASETIKRLVRAGPCDEYPTENVEVPNRYDGGTHYENVPCMLYVHKL